MNTKNNGKRLMAAVAVLALIACAFMAVGVASEESDGAPASQMTGEEFLKEATENQGVITLDKNVELTKPVVLTESLTINLNGFTLSSADEVRNMFYNAGEDTSTKPGTKNVDLVINGEKEGSAIDASQRIAYFKADECSLTITGGTYTAGDYGFIWYAANTLSPPANNITVSNITIDSSEAAFWLSNRAIENAEFTKCKITSDFMGIYFGTVQKATITNCEIAVSGTDSDSAVEIKAGDVTFDGCTISATNYHPDNTVASGGNGPSESAITINNGYNDSAGTDAVIVTIKNSTITNSASNSKPVIVTSVNDNPIFFAWEGHDVNDVATTGKKDNITIGTISGDETTAETNSVDKANDLLDSESVDKVVLTGDVDISTELSVPKDKTLVISGDTNFTGIDKKPIAVAKGGIIEVNTTSSNAKSFTIKGGDQTDEVTFTNVSGNFTITGGSVIVSGEYNGTITGSGSAVVKLTGNISGDVNITWSGISGTGGKVIFDDATLSSNCKVTLDPNNNITYRVDGELRVYGTINSSDKTEPLSINVPADQTVKAYASATIGNGVYFEGAGDIDLGSSMSTGYWSEDIASDMTWSQAQKTIIDGTMTIKSGYTLTVLGELVIDEGVTVYIEDDAKLQIGETNGATAVGITINGTIEVAQGGTFDVQNAKDVTVTGQLYSEGIVNITSNVTVKSGGSIFIDESYDETSPSKITANNGLTIEAGGSITISSEMTITEINNKGTVNLVDAILTGESKIIQAADGAVVNIDSITGAQGTSDTELIVTDSGLVFEKDKTSANDIKVSTDSNAFSVKLNYQKGISGIVITESVTSEKVGNDTKYSNAMYISGNVTAVNEAADATSSNTTVEFTIRGDGGNDGGFYIGAEDSLNLGAGVTMKIKNSTVSSTSASKLYVEGTLTATGTNSEIKYDTTGAGTVDIYVNGTVTTLNGKTAIKDNINAFHYTGTDTNKYEYYTTLNNALAASKDIEYIGDVSVMENATIPADTKVSAVSVATMTVGDADNRDVVLTVADGGILRNGKITVNGTLVFENNKDGNKGNEIISHVQIDENPKMTFTNVYTALDNATSGKVEIRQDVNVVLDSDIEVKEGVTLVIPDSATVTMYNGVTLTVNGTVENSGDIVNDMPKENGNYVVGEEPAGFNPMDGDETNTDAAKIVVNGAFKSMDYTAYEATTGQVGYYIPGAYYQIIDTEGSWYWITPVEDAAAVAADVDAGIAIYGEVTVGDVTFAGSTEEGADPVGITVNGKLTAGTITLDNAAFVVPANVGQYDGTVSTAVGSVAFVNVRYIAVADTVDADDNEIMVLAGTPAKADLKGADTTVTVATGNVTVISSLTIETYDESTNTDGLKSFTIADAATVTVMDASGTPGELKADNLTVNGTLVAIDGGNVNVTGTLTVRGTFTVAEKTDDNTAGTASVNKLLIGIAVNEDGEYGDASAGTVNADSIDRLASIVMSAESTFSGKQIESMKATEFYVEDALWITAYAGTSADRIVTAATGDDKDPTYGFKPADMTESMFVAWNDKDGKAITATTNVGQVDAVYANIDYNVYGVVITVDNSIGSVAIDGQLLTYNSDAGGYIIPGDDPLLTAGQHNVTYTLAAGYEGTPTLASNGTNVTVSGMNFTLSGDFLKSDGTPNINYLTLGGATYSGNTVVIEGGNGGSSDMGLTDYLLIILVILIVVMAIIVAMRLMRS